MTIEQFEDNDETECHIVARNQWDKDQDEKNIKEGKFVKDSWNGVIKEVKTSKDPFSTILDEARSEL